MGIDYQCHAVIGYEVEFTAKDHAETFTRQSCDHAERIGHKFCPKCGTKVVERQETYWGNVVDAIDNLDCDATCEGIVLVQTDYDYGDTLKCMVGYGISIDPIYGDNRKLPMIEKREIEDRIMRFLALNGLDFRLSGKDIDFHLISTAR